LHLIGSTGNIIFTQHGDLFDAIHYDGATSFVPIAGKTISSSVTTARVDCGRLYVLTDDALSAFMADDSLVLTQVFMTHVDKADGFVVSGHRLILWVDNQVMPFTLESDGHMIASPIISTGI